MLEISLDQLKQLLPGKLQESDYEIADGVSFKKLCRKYQGVLTNSVSVSSAYDSFVRNVLLRHREIKFVGDGSSRTAFACVGGKCVKVAKVFAGVEQNRQEEKHTSRHWWKRSYDCFAVTYGHSEGYEMLLSECCARIKNDRDFAAAFGLDDRIQLTFAIWAVANEKSHDVGKSATSLRAKCATWQRTGGVLNGVKLTDDNVSMAERAFEWLESLRGGNASTPGERSFLQIADFWRRNGTDELLPGDVCTCLNWGYAIRQDELTPIMLDVGFSKKVADKFYGGAA